ncbi:MAG: HK97-gp10 family putative phage morphogenesis protein [Carboxydocellales bacterium]
MAEITLTGFDDLIAKLQELGDKADIIENHALKAGGKVLQKAASEKAQAHRSSKSKKHLADNIKISGIRRRNGVKYVLVGPDKGDDDEFFYGKFLEWGTSKMPAQPFMGPAAAESKNDVVGAMKTVVKAGLGL